MIDKRGSVLVTGGAGFIGSHLCERLLDDGYKVINVDNFNRFYNPEIKRDNIKDMVNKDGYVLCEGDIRDADFIDSVLQSHDPKLVIHLAAMAGVRPSIESPILYHDINVIGSLTLLEACRRYEIRKFVFASSSSVYGNNETPFKESDCVNKPVSPYASSKIAGELLCYNYHYLYNFSTLCLRFFTVYGPRQRPDLAIHKFSKIIDQEGVITAYGDGSNSRDYTYIDDIVEGIMRAVCYINCDTRKPLYDVFNLGNSYPVSLKRMISVLEDTIGKKAKVHHGPLQAGDVTSTYADITHSSDVLGYSPSTGFDEGIYKFVKWFLNERGE